MKYGSISGISWDLSYHRGVFTYSDLLLLVVYVDRFFTFAWFFQTFEATLKEIVLLEFHHFHANKTLIMLVIFGNEKVRHRSRNGSSLT